MSSLTVNMTPPWRVKTLPGLFRERLRESEEETAYLVYNPASDGWEPITWGAMAKLVIRWQNALHHEELREGDRVAIQHRNDPEWVAFDLAALGLGLVVVPLYANDRPENVAHILKDSGSKLLVVDQVESWQALLPLRDSMPDLRRVVCPSLVPEPLPLLVTTDDWLPPIGLRSMQFWDGNPNKLATIVYTSGTTGQPKGVMLSHRNILANVFNSLRYVPAYKEDLFLSFLPLCHALERTAGYYLPMMAGAVVAYARSIALLAEDMQRVRPTVMISVPRIYERIHHEIYAKVEHAPAWKRRLFTWTVRVGWRRFLWQQQRAQWSVALLAWPLLDLLVAAKIRAKLGGRLRASICGGAPLHGLIARFFIGLGIPMTQGYGLTETSPVISVNPLRDNEPTSVGAPLPGVEVRIDEESGELLVRGPIVMLGYWNNPEATRKAIDSEGWLHTGDIARMERGHLFITGRLKEIIVLANGRKISPVDLEAAIVMDALFAQVMIIGEQRPFLTALVGLDPGRWRTLAATLNLNPDDPGALQNPALHQHLLERIAKQLHSFPGFAKIRCLYVLTEPWSVENGLITPTLKLRRSRVATQYSQEINALYQGHTHADGLAEEE